MTPLETSMPQMHAGLPWAARPWSIRADRFVSPMVTRIVLALSAAGSVLRPIVFPAMWLFIGVVSSYDAYLTIKYEDSIGAMELNPLGQFLLQQNDGDAALFMGMKFVGTIFVLGFLNLIHRLQPRWGMWMTSSVATFQGGLLGFLSL